MDISKPLCSCAARVRTVSLLLSISALTIVASAQDTELLSIAGAQQANDRSESPDCSADGRYVVWQTLASNLVPNDGNGTWDVLLRDRQTGTIELISRTPQGGALGGSSTEPSISANGRFIAFRTGANDVEPGMPSGLWVYDRVMGS